MKKYAEMGWAPLSGLGTPVYFHLLILFLFRLTGFAGFASIKIGE